MTRQHPLDSAADCPSGTTVTSASDAAVTGTRWVGLVTKQVDVDEVGAEAAPSDATGATQAALATTAATDPAEHRQHGTVR
ncbi:MAG: hypothetical protein ACRDS0_11835 [Pseudonocardiaceae bacterium]